MFEEFIRNFFFDGWGFSSTGKRIVIGILLSLTVCRVVTSIVPVLAVMFGPLHPRRWEWRWRPYDISSYQIAISHAFDQATQPLHPYIASDQMTSHYKARNFKYYHAGFSMTLIFDTKETFFVSFFFFVSSHAIFIGDLAVLFDFLSTTKMGTIFFSMFLNSDKSFNSSSSLMRRLRTQNYRTNSSHLWKRWPSSVPTAPDSAPLNLVSCAAPGSTDETLPEHERQPWMN